MRFHPGRLVLSGRMDHLKLSFLGSPHIELNGEPIGFDRRAAVAFLAYLASSQTRITRDLLITLLWPNLGESQARAAMRTTRAVVAAKIGAHRLGGAGESISLIRGDDLWIDLDEFHR